MNLTTMRPFYTLVFLIITGALIAQDSWTPRASYPASNPIATSAFTIGDLGYVFNKVASSTATSSTLYAYDPSTNSWTQKASLNAPREKSATFAINGIGYVCTGSAGVGTNTLHAYDPVTDSWSQKADFPGSPRAAAVAFVIGEKAYVGSGLVAPSPFTYLDDFYCYDPATDSWSQIASIPGGVRYDASAFTVVGKGYVFGGRDALNYLSSMYAYDPTTDTWQPRAFLAGGPLNRPAAFSIGDRGFVGTGHNGNDWVAHFHEYDPFLDTWTLRANYPEARVWTIGFSIADKGYVGLGLSSNGAFHRYDPIQLPVNVEELPVTPRSRIYPNPAKGACWLELENAGEGPVVIIVRDAAGREVWSRATPATSTAPIPLDLSRIPEGVYTITASIAGTRWVERVVIGGELP